MGSSDDDDDVHYCVKCHNTIIGLDKYVEHRKTKCGRIVLPEPRKSLYGEPSTSRIIETPRNETERSDFFSMLELKSSDAVKTIGNLTGGKAKVIVTRSKSKNIAKIPSPAEKAEGKELSDEDEESDAESWSHRPPPGHTGGKWKPGGSSSSPPPSHTKGKWGPQERELVMKKVGGSLYWCGSCNRRLSNRLMYDRHLKSYLHFKRTHQEQQLELETRTKTQRSKRMVTRPVIQSYTVKFLRKIHSQKKQSSKISRRTVICDVCKARVYRHHMGKHLVSHYHCRNIPDDPQRNNDLVLEFIDGIVKQAPFQCQLCHFYSNRMEDFVSHWTSEMHLRNDKLYLGKYWCSGCKFTTDSSVSMGFHLVRPEHKEVVAVINRSVPIMILKWQVLQCEVCNKEFRYNAELRQHAERRGHLQAVGTGSNSYQEIIECEKCTFKARSLRSYNVHVRIRHEEDKLYHCGICNEKFRTFAEVKQHRNSTEHRDRVEKNGPPRECAYCGALFEKILELKEHLKQSHPDQSHRCMICGESFLLRQELAQHVRSKACKITENRVIDFSSDFDSRPSQDRQSCQSCSFVGGSKAELAVHCTIVHNSLENPQSSSSSSVPLYNCLYCLKPLQKRSLLRHIQSHLDDLPFSCSICNKRFLRRDQLAEHCESEHIVRLFKDKTTNYRCSECSLEFPSKLSFKKHKAYHRSNLNQKRSSQAHQCHHCQKTFLRKSTLILHSQLHIGKKFKCEIPGCTTETRSQSELNTHMLTHQEERKFACSQCIYAAKTKGQLAKHVKSKHSEVRHLSCSHCDYRTNDGAHLRRHMRCHTGSKPFKCPYCDYSCNLQENLRKHVIKSKKHPGEFLYKCSNDACEFKTNLAKEFNAHLMDKHGHTSSSLHRNEAAVTSGIYQPSLDVTDLSQGQIPVLSKPRKKTPSTHTVLEEIYEVEEVPEGNPTLASVAINPTKADVPDDSMFVQLQSSGQEEYEVPFLQFRQSFPISTPSHFVEDMLLQVDQDEVPQIQSDS